MELGAMVQEMLTPELTPLIPALYFIGIGLKKMGSIEDKHIPIIIGVISIFLNALYVFSTVKLSTPQDVAGAVLTTIIQGILFAGAPVYINQIYKQESKKG